MKRNRWLACGVVVAGAGNLLFIKNWSLDLLSCFSFGFCCGIGFAIYYRTKESLQ